jgi:hypothetical protein
MVPASEQGQMKRLPGRLGLSLVVVACLVQAGCARLSPFRKADTPPAFGTETASADGDKKGQPGGGDFYAERVGRSKPAAEIEPSAVLAGADRQPEHDAVATRAGSSRSAADPSDAAPAVALQSPVTLPAFSETGDGLKPVASKNRSTGWQAEAKTLAALTPVSHENAPRPAEAAVPAPVVATPAGPSLETLVASSRKAIDSVSSYQVKMNQQERLGTILSPAEDMVLCVRRNPKAVRLEWHEGIHKGREVLYASDANNGLMHIRMGESLLALTRLSMAPDSPIALKSGRHPITEAGFETIIGNLEDGLRKQKAGDQSGGRLTYGGLEKPEGVDKACHKVVRLTPAGETWVVYLDPDTKFPTFVQETGADGTLLERYIFRDLTPDLPELAKAEAFDPDARWGAPKGLLQRLARSPGSDDGTKAR